MQSVQEQKRPAFVYDMETQDPDDVLALSVDGITKLLVIFVHPPMIVLQMKCCVRCALTRPLS